MYTKDTCRDSAGRAVVVVVAEGAEGLIIPESGNSVDEDRGSNPAPLLGFVVESTKSPPVIS